MFIEKTSDPVAGRVAEILRARARGLNGFPRRGAGAVGSGVGTVQDVALAAQDGMGALGEFDAAIQAGRNKLQAAAGQIQSLGVSGAANDLQSIAANLDTLAGSVNTARSRLSQLDSFYAPARNDTFALGNRTPPPNQTISEYQEAQSLAGQVRGQIPAVASAASGISAILQAATIAAQQASQVAAQQQVAASAAAAANARNAVLAALNQAQVQVQQDLYDAAYATLQNPSVMAAASTAGMSGDITSALAAIGSAQRAAQADADRAEAAAQAAATTAANREAAQAASAVQASQVQAQAVASAQAAGASAVQIEQMRQQAAAEDRRAAAALAAQAAEAEGRRQEAADIRAAAERREATAYKQQELRFQSLPQLIAALGPLGPVILAKYLPGLLESLGLEGGATAAPAAAPKATSVRPGVAASGRRSTDERF